MGKLNLNKFKTGNNYIIKYPEKHLGSNGGPGGVVNNINILKNKTVLLTGAPRERLPNTFWVRGVLLDCPGVERWEYSFNAECFDCSDNPTYISYSPKNRLVKNV